MITSIDEYFALFPADVQSRLQTVRRTIAAAAPMATEKISYAMPTFYLHGNLVHFAAFAHHVGFYPGAGGVAAFEDRLSDYVHAKGSIQFPHTKALPLDLITNIVAFRVQQQMEKAKKPSK